MIQITKATESALLGIKAGHITNAQLSGYLGITRETACARVARLRKAGLVTAVKKDSPTLPTYYLEFSATDKPYKVMTNSRGPKLKERRKRTYAELGEETFDSLNNYLYPNQ